MCRSFSHSWTSNLQICIAESIFALYIEHVFQIILKLNINRFLNRQENMSKENIWTTRTTTTWAITKLALWLGFVNYFPSHYWMASVFTVAQNFVEIWTTAFWKFPRKKLHLQPSEVLRCWEEKLRWQRSWFTKTTGKRNFMMMHFTKWREASGLHRLSIQQQSAAVAFALLYRIWFNSINFIK